MKTAQGPVSSTQSGPHSAAPTPAPAPVSTASPGLTGLRGGLSGGSPLPADLRSRMESGFGTSFADVRVHTGAAAAQATGQLRAEAFATGPDIAFAPGRYRPGSQAGQGLIAHELAHVLQQRRSGGGGAVQAKSLVSTPGDAAETCAVIIGVSTGPAPGATAPGRAGASEAAGDSDSAPIPAMARRMIRPRSECPTAPTCARPPAITVAAALSAAVSAASPGPETCDFICTAPPPPERRCCRTWASSCAISP